LEVVEMEIVRLSGGDAAEMCFDSGEAIEASEWSRAFP